MASKDESERQKRERKGQGKGGKKGGTGAGAEAAEGMHSVDDRSAARKSGVDSRRDADETGSEPLKHRTSNPKGSYGGEGGKPRE